MINKKYFEISTKRFRLGNEMSEWFNFQIMFKDKNIRLYIKFLPLFKIELHKTGFNLYRWYLMGLSLTLSINPFICKFEKLCFKQLFGNTKVKMIRDIKILIENRQDEKGVKEILDLIDNISLHT